MHTDFRLFSFLLQHFSISCKVKTVIVHICTCLLHTYTHRHTSQFISRKNKYVIWICYVAYCWVDWNLFDEKLIAISTHNITIDTAFITKLMKCTTFSMNCPHTRNIIIYRTTSYQHNNKNQIKCWVCINSAFIQFFFSLFSLFVWCALLLLWCIFPIYIISHNKVRY